MPAARLPRWANRYPPRGFAPRSARRYTKPRGSPLLTTGTTSAVPLRGVNFARRLGVNIESRLTLWADTMVIMEASENKDAAHAFIDYVLRPDVGAWVASNILYKVPNAQAMEGLDPALYEAFPNLAMKPADLLALEALRDVGDAMKLYSRTVTEITASE